MKKIPEDKLRFYTEPQISLMTSRLRLVQAYGNEYVSGLESKIILTAFELIKKRGIEPEIIFDEKIYREDMKRKKTEGEVYLLCDKQFNLLDITPLLDFVSSKERKKYERAKRRYSSC